MTKLPTNESSRQYILPPWLETILTSRITLALSFTGTVVLAYILLGIDQRLANDGMGIVYLELAFTSFNFRGVLLSWGPDGIELFLSTIWLDFIFPVAYSLLLSSTAAFLLRQRTISENPPLAGFMYAACFAPFVAAAFDYVENLLHILIISNRLFSDMIIAMASAMAAVKFILLITVLVFFLFTTMSMIKGVISVRNSTSI
ncbi:MAG TPA: hypothetical protein VKQ10_02125 [Spirochaetota bacterium]|nr:hypothetical protein [Spirochaetota bacterium]